MGTDALTASEFQSTAGTQDWRVIGADALAWFATTSHAEGAALARRVLEGSGEAAGGGRGVEIDVDIRAKGVRLRIVRPGSRFTSAEVEAARGISAAAADLGLAADPTRLQLVQIGIDTQDTPSLMGFWERVLGHERRGDVALRDPHRRLPSMWFQELDEARPLRNRLHLDVVTPSPGAASTLAAIPELDGQIPQQNDFYATIADTDGNEADILPLPDGADRWEGEGTEDWRLVFAAVAAYPTLGTEQALELAEATAALADEAGLALGIDLQPGLVVLDSGKDLWEMVEGYEALAARVQAAARGLGLTADTGLPRFVQVGFDAVDIEGVRAFWAAALGYEQDPREDVTDLVHPHQLTMPVFFQPMDEGDHERRAQRNRIHLDVFVADDQAQARVDAALAAGGRITYDAEAPAWWTIADPEGNEVCIAVSPGREERWDE
ncbi:VOC family protein [Ornithinimicrobium panacihumi]|uniref:VOC family protein n=1 Tax=Ornithinimicrobium panacihumi TaxID=2008449 RepID=UPI003F8B4D31